MSSVLYDEPGPKARRRSLIGTIVATIAILALLWVVYRRLDEQGQFDGELWGPLVDPSNETFPLVWQVIGEGLVATLVAAALAIGLSLIIGTLLGVTRMMLGKVQRIPLVGLIELFRGLPVVVTIFYVYAVAQTTDLDISALPGEDGLWYLVIGLTLYNSVIIAEILRAGVASLPSGQRESALAVGMTPRQAMFTVQLPQAFRIMLPALISQLVVILKDTSIAAVLALYPELLRDANRIALNLDNPIQVFIVVGLIYILINYALSQLATRLERRISTRQGGVDTGQVDHAVAAT